jgi:hypothetical protein
VESRYVRKEAAWLVSKTNWNRNSDWSLITVTDGFDVVLCFVLIAIDHGSQKIKRSCDLLAPKPTFKQPTPATNSEASVRETVNEGGA